MISKKEKLKEIIFWGATGQAKVLRESAEYFGWQLVALFDNNKNLSSPFKDVPLYFGKNGFQAWRAKKKNKDVVAFLVAIGGDRGRDRLKIQHYLESKGMNSVKLIHPTAFVAKNVHLGKGSQILAQSAVCVNAKIGEACIVNTGAIIDHDTKLAKGVHVAPGANIAGEVEVGEYSFIGIGAVVLPRVRIGKNVIVGAGSVVRKNISDNLVVCGNPAGKLRNNFLIK